MRTVVLVIWLAAGCHGDSGGHPIDSGGDAPTDAVADGSGACVHQFPGMALGASNDALAVGDFDGDGKLDIVVAGFNGPHGQGYEVEHNQGHGVFGSAFVGGNDQSIAVVVADFNHDGHLDLAGATIDLGYFGVVVRLGATGPTFGDPVLFPTTVDPTTSGNPYDLVAADFDGDNNLDLAVANLNSNTVAVLFGRGDGTFGPPQEYPVGNLPQHIAAGDVNGDGKPDLAVVDVGSDDVRVLLNTGSGTFGAATPLVGGTGNRGVAIADVNHDLEADIIVTSAGDSTIGVFAGTGTGTFGPRQSYPNSADATVLAVGDLNGDGKPDVVTASDLGTVTVLLNNGTSFAAPTVYSDLGNVHAVAIADLDGDGNSDVILNTFGVTTVLRGRGDGTLISSREYDAGTSASLLAIGDVDGDGKLDAVVGSFTQSTLGTLLATPGGFAAPIASSTVSSLDALILADVDLDTHLDVVALRAHDVVVMRGDGHGAFAAPVAYATGMFPNAVVAVDLNGDGAPELVVANANDGNVGVLQNDGHGAFSAMVPFAIAEPVAMATGDFDHDGKQDLVVASYALPTFAGTLSFMQGNGDASFAGPIAHATGFHPAAVGVHDFDGDTKLDVVVANEGNPSSLPGGVDMFDGTGDGGFGTATALISPTDLRGPVGVSFGDVDGDGRSDIAVGSYDGRFLVLFGLPGGTFVRSPTFPGYSPKLIDVDGDGAVDAVYVAGTSVVVSPGTCW